MTIESALEQSNLETLHSYIAELRSNRGYFNQDLLEKALTEIVALVETQEYNSNQLLDLIMAHMEKGNLPSTSDVRFNVMARFRRAYLDLTQGPV